MVALHQQAVADYNARIGAVDARVSEWNVRNAQLNDKAKALEDERAGWVTSCADRRYREEDENAIKAGK